MTEKTTRPQRHNTMREPEHPTDIYEGLADAAFEIERRARDVRIAIRSAPEPGITIHQALSALEDSIGIFAPIY